MFSAKLGPGSGSIGAGGRRRWGRSRLELPLAGTLTCGEERRYIWAKIYQNLVCDEACQRK